MSLSLDIGHYCALKLATINTRIHRHFHKKGSSTPAIIVLVTVLIVSVSVSTMSEWEKLSEQLRHPDNPVVFMEITAGGTPIGTIKMELFADVVPKTVENFRQFCTGEYRKDGVPIGYKNAQFHRVIKDFMIQGGDFVNNDGTGMTSIYASKFPDENFELKHTGPGVLSMANAGADTNGCQFFVTCAKCEFLDNKHVVFGRVLDGLLTVRKIENVPTGQNNKPKIPIVIAQCGQL